MDRPLYECGITGRYNAGSGTRLRRFILYPLYSAIHVSLCLFFLHHPHRTFHQLIISLPEARACPSPLFSSLANFSLSHSFSLPPTLLRFTCMYLRLPLFRLTLFCSGNRPGRVCFILPDICLFFPSSFFSFRFECPLPSLYAGRSCKWRIIVGPRPILLFRNEQCGRPPSLRLPVFQPACV